MRSQKNKYLIYLNDNYFYEIGYIKKESKLKYIEMKKQYRSNQGRSPSAYGGFRLYPSSGNWAPDPEINIYGMRSPAY